MIVYGLIDPATKQLRYVGQTSRRLRDRYAQHLRSANERTTPPVNAWIRGLIKSGGKPEIIQIEALDCIASLNESEEFFIAYARCIGADLLNVRAGGSNFTGMRHTPEQRSKWSRERRGEKAGNFGKRWSLEARQAASERVSRSLRENGHPGKGKKRTAEQRRRISEARVGKRYAVSPAGMDARRAATAKLWSDPDHRKKMSRPGLSNPFCKPIEVDGKLYAASDLAEIVGLEKQTVFKKARAVQGRSLTFSDFARSPQRGGRPKKSVAPA